MMDLNKLAAEIHAAAVEKGFWAVDNALEKHVAKMHSELGEVVQADRAGIMYETEREGAKPEGIAAELADFVMMTLDYIAYVMEDDAARIFSINVELEGAMDDEPAYRIALALHRALSHVAEMKDGEGIRGLLACIHFPAVWLERRGYDIWEIIRAKMEYNRTRPALHGRAY